MKLLKIKNETLNIVYMSSNVATAQNIKVMSDKLNTNRICTIPKHEDDAEDDDSIFIIIIISSSSSSISRVVAVVVVVTVAVVVAVVVVVSSSSSSSSNSSTPHPILFGWQHREESDGHDM